MLDDEHATQSFVTVANQLANAQIPQEARRAIGLGRITALQKPNGRVRGIVVGDLFRRLVARCLAQRYSEPIATACRPHQFALSTRAGAEAVVHNIAAATEANPALTVLSIDGIGAYDTIISRHSMLTALRAVPQANRCSSFVNMFYSEPSQYVWHDQHGEGHIITQAEGGEQGDPLMPALFSLGQKAGSPPTCPIAAATRRSLVRFSG